MVEWDGGDLADLRHSFYRFFAACLQAPTSQGLAQLADLVPNFDPVPLEVFPFYDPWQQLKATLQSGPDANAARADFSHLFLASAPRVRCPVYESAFLSANGGQDAGLIIAGVEQAYRRRGMVMTSDLKELPDHVLVQLGAMAFLCRREARAWQAEQPDTALKALEDQHRFLPHHLGVWFPLFARRVARQAQGSFYPRVVEAADAFIQHDLDLLAGLADSVSATTPGNLLSQEMVA